MRKGNLLVLTIAVLLIVAEAEQDDGSFLSQLKAASLRIMADGATDDEVHDATVAYSDLFQNTLGIPPDGWRRETSLKDGGVAISPRDAVDCITEGGGKRTKSFIGALREAITEKNLQKKSSELVRVIEVGSGPYAPVMMAMWAYFHPSQVRFTLIDIHAPSAETLSPLTALLGDTFNASVRVLCQDGLDVELEQGENAYDIALAEIMGPALRREPQVQAFAALSRVLDQEKGVMIPDSVRLTAKLPSSFFGVKARFQFFEISLQNAQRFVSIGRHVSLKIALPPEAARDQLINGSVAIGAHLRLFQNWELAEGDSQITLSLPHRCGVEHMPEERREGPLALALGYRVGPDPGPFCVVTANLHNPRALSFQTVMESQRRAEGPATAAEGDHDCAARVFWKERAAMRRLCEHTLVQPEL